MKLSVFLLLLLVCSSLNAAPKTNAAPVAPTPPVPIPLNVTVKQEPLTVTVKQEDKPENPKMSRFERQEIVIGWSTIGVTVLTLFALIIYAYDTRRLRNEASRQASLIAQQVEEMARQSGLLSDQLALNTESFAAQKAAAEQEKAATERLWNLEKQKYEDALIKAEEEDTAEFTVIGSNKNAERSTFVLHNIKENAALINFRSLPKGLRIESLLPYNEHTRQISVPVTEGTFYLGIEYRSKISGKLRFAVYECDTRTGVGKKDTMVPYNTLAPLGAV